MVAFSDTKFDIDNTNVTKANNLGGGLVDLRKEGNDEHVNRLDPARVFKFNDPFFSRQWHLYNRKVPGNDVNVTPVWKKGITGKGVVVCIIDDGVDHTHKDIARAFRSDLSWDFNEGVNVPIPRFELNDRHGTRCAGLIAGEANNGICGVGVAYDAQVSAIRILSRNLSTKSEAEAVTYRYHDNHIYSCSWGPADDGKALDGPPKRVLEAFVDGLVNGRDGKGSVYVFAAGNGKSVDNCNFDGYANGAFSMTIGAIDNNNAMPVYMEPCSAQLAVTYSSGLTEKITTTDLGSDSCTSSHGGTSAAAPLAAGILALALQARPELTWRDIQYLVVESAQPVATLDPTWQKNGAGLNYSQKFGFGKIDADKLVTLAQNFRLVRPQVIISLPYRTLDASIPVKFSIGLSDTIVLDSTKHRELKWIDRMEFLTVTVDIEHPKRGELQVFIRSPSGMVAQLASRRPLDDSEAGLRGWTFMTVAFWGEAPPGPWTLNVVDKRSEGQAGILHSWRMTLWGESAEGCDISKTDYTQAFINAYYPPSPDYFADNRYIWKDLADDKPCPLNSRSLLVSGFFFILLVFAVYALCRILHRIVTNKAYRQVPTNRINQM